LIDGMSLGTLASKDLNAKRAKPTNAGQGTFFGWPEFHCHTLDHIIDDVETACARLHHCNLAEIVRFSCTGGLRGDKLVAGLFSSS
jgi:hypothetical protein